MLIDGEPGVGKSALIRCFLERHDIDVMEASGDEAEGDLPFGVLDQLVRSVTGPVPEPLRALTSRPPAAVDPVTAGAALLDVLGQVQGTKAVVVVIDDAQWVDLASVQALSFAVRRLVADRVLVVLVGRRGELGVLPEGLMRVTENRGRRMHLEGLSAEELVALADAVASPVNLATARALRDQTEGNPLYATAVLVEGLLDSVAAGTGRPVPAPENYAELVGRRLARCSPDAQRLLAAAAVLGQSAPLGRSARVAGLDDPLPAADDAVGQGLVTLSSTAVADEISFAHALARSAVYHAIPPLRRAELHRAAAAQSTDPLEALRHRVAAAAAPDIALSEELERFSVEEAARGSWLSAAWAMLAAGRLSNTRHDRERRILAGIEHAITAGDAATVATLAPTLADFTDTPRLRYVSGALALLGGQPGDVEVLLRSAIDALGQPPDDPDLAGAAGHFLGLLLLNQGRASESLEWARGALVRAVEEGAGGPYLVFAAPSIAAAGLTEEALELSAGVPSGDDLNGVQTEMLTGRGLVHIWQEDLRSGWDDLQRVLSVARRQGPFTDRLIALFYLADVAYRLGRWDDAVTYGELAASAAEDADQPYVYALVHGVASWPLAGRGEWDRAAHHARAARQSAEAVGDLASVLWAAMAAGRLAHARRDAAGTAAAFAPLLSREHTEGLWDPGVQPWEGLYSEALVGIGDLAGAEKVVGNLEHRMGTDGLISARSDAARVRGMLEAAKGNDQDAAEAFEASLALLDGVERPFLLGRNELAFGEHLRRRGKRAAAGQHLTRALARFEALRARPYVERTRAELVACGQRRAAPVETSRVSLTPQELAVANLVARGRSNREVAAELVVSVKTIEYHLGNIYAKLALRSRSELTRWMLDVPAEA